MTSLCSSETLVRKLGEERLKEVGCDQGPETWVRDGGKKGLADIIVKPTAAWGFLP